MPTPPKNAKKPTDHQPAKAEVGGERTITIRGREFTVAADALDDFELLDDLDQLERGNVTRMPAVLRRLVGDDQFRPLLDLARDADTGRVTNESGSELVAEVLGALDPNS